MRKLLVISLSLSAALLLFASASAADGTMEGPVPDTGNGQDDAGVVQVTDGSFLITPFESVSISQTQTWPDNRHRAYWIGSVGNVNGFLLFDVTEIPDTDQIISMTLRCYLENDFGSPAYDPIVDVYYSADDAWTRQISTVT